MVAPLFVLAGAALPVITTVVTPCAIPAIAGPPPGKPGGHLGEEQCTRNLQIAMLVLGGLGLTAAVASTNTAVRSVGIGVAASATVLGLLTLLRSNAPAPVPLPPPSPSRAPIAVPIGERGLVRLGTAGGAPELGTPTDPTLEDLIVVVDGLGDEDRLRVRAVGFRRRVNGVLTRTILPASDSFVVRAAAVRPEDSTERMHA